MASREQTKQQKQTAKDAAQPMVWVDIRGDDGQGQAPPLLLGHSGPSIARNVKVVFDPAPPSTLDIKPILEILEQGIASLARVLRRQGISTRLQLSCTR